MIIKVEFDNAEKALIDAIVREELKKKYDEKILIDVKDLCEMLDVSRPTAEKLYKNNPAFPSIRVGSKWLFVHEEVKNYISQQG
jgi:excisionase family DNA binding protein